MTTTSLLARARLWLRSTVHRPQVESDMEDEIRFHLDARTADLMAAGHPPSEAARQARIEFGGTATHKDGMRAALGLRWPDDLLADLRYAVRLLHKSPGFTAIAVTSLALAIGANTAIFSVANEMLYARLNVPRPRELRLLLIQTPKNRRHSAVHGFWTSCCADAPNGDSRNNSFSYPIYRQLQQNSHSLSTIFGYKDFYRVNVTANGVAQTAHAQLVSGNFYSGMEVKTQLGRPIQPADEGAPGTAPVAVISDGFWHSTFGGSPSVLGKTLNVNGSLVTIVGVNPPGFTGAESVQQSPEVFLPISMVTSIWSQLGKENLLETNETWWMEVMARARPGISDIAASAELSTLLEAAVRGTMHPKPDETIPRVTLEDGSRGVHIGGDYRDPLRILLGMVALVLLLACANTANLMLARASARTREMSVRLALGASRGRVLRQVLTESLLLAGMGGAVGLLLGYSARNLLPRLLADPWERNDLNIPFDWRVFCFAALVTVATGILFGLLPAWRATRSQVNTGLKESGISASRRRKAWSGKGIVVFQIALSTLLVIGSALFLRTLWNLNHIEAGFYVPHLVDFDLSIPSQRYPKEKSIGVSQHVLESVAAIPGVEGIALSSIPLIGQSMSMGDVYIEGAPKRTLEPSDNSQSSSIDTVSGQFFPVLKIPILRGRGFGPQDTSTSARVIVVNQSFVRRFFPNVDPLGRRINGNSNLPGDAKTWLTIIGICPDIHYTDMKEHPLPVLYFDLDRQQKDLFGGTVMLRTTLPPEALATSLRHALQQVDPDIPVINLRTQQQQIDSTLNQERLFAALTAGFGLLALLLATVGIYGIMAYTVTQRTNEIGIRLALGAPRAHVRAMVLREAAWLSVLGVAAGLALVLTLVHLVKTMLYGLPPRDPASLVATALLLLTVALLAAWLPAARASRVEPMIALRHE